MLKNHLYWYLSVKLEGSHNLGQSHLWTGLVDELIPLLDSDHFSINHDLENGVDQIYLVLQLEVGIGIFELSLEPGNIVLSLGLFGGGCLLGGLCLWLLTELAQIDDAWSSRIEFLDLPVPVASLLKMEVLIGILLGVLQQLGLVGWGESLDVSLNSVSDGLLCFL